MLPHRFARPVVLLGLLSLPACSAAGQSDAEAREAFAAYQQCLADVADAIEAGDAAPAVNACFGAESAQNLLDNLDALGDWLTRPPTDARLVGTGRGDQAPGVVELHVLDTQDGQRVGTRVAMARTDTEWRIAQMRFVYQQDAFESPPGTPPIETEVYVEGDLVLNSEVGVWTSTNAGFPILSFTSLFDGPELQIDNLTTSSPSQSLDSNYLGDFSSTPDRVQVRYRDDIVNSSWDLQGTLTVDDVTDGRMSGVLRLQLRTLVEGPIGVEMRFANLPVP